MDKNIQKALLQLEKYDFDNILFVKKKCFTLNHTKEIIVKEFEDLKPEEEEVKATPTIKSQSINIVPWGSAGITTMGSVSVNFAPNGTVWFSYDVEKPDVIKDYSTSIELMYGTYKLDDMYEDNRFNKSGLIVFQVNEESDGIYFPYGNSVRGISFWQEPSEKVGVTNNTIF